MAIIIAHFCLRQTMCIPISPFSFHQERGQTQIIGVWSARGPLWGQTANAAGATAGAPIFPGDLKF